MVVMEALQESTWKPLHELVDTKLFVAGTAAAKQTLARAQQIPVYSDGALGVHGDLRHNNIMVRIADGVVEACFIDFDWAGQHNEAR